MGLPVKLNLGGVLLAAVSTRLHSMALAGDSCVSEGPSSIAVLRQACCV